MNALFAPRLRTVRRLVAVAALGACAVAVSAGSAGAAAPSKAHGAAGKTLTLHYYSHVVGFVYRRADGTTLPQPPQQPAVGDQLEVTELGYKGTHKSHAKKFSASTYTLCIFKAAKAPPTCEGVATVGGAELMIFHTAPDSDPVLVNGTGRWAGATGGVKMTEIAGSNDSDIVITVKLAK